MFSEHFVHPFINTTASNRKTPHEKYDQLPAIIEQKGRSSNLQQIGTPIPFFTEPLSSLLDYANHVILHLPKLAQRSFSSPHTLYFAMTV